jgi:predicted PurR-regulated permease PerM
MSERGLEPRVIYRAVILAFALFMGASVLGNLVPLLLLGLLTIIVAIALSAAADALDRLRVPRPIGVLATLLVGLAAIGGLIALVAPAFSHEVDQFSKTLPGTVEDLRRQVGNVTGSSPSEAGARLQRFVQDYTQHPDKLLGPAASVGQGIAGAIGAIVVLLVTAIYTAISPNPLIEGTTRLFAPARRPHVRHVLSRLATTYMGWLRGLVIGAVILGVLTYIGLRLVELPFAIFFSIFTAVAIVVPYFGSIVSSIPPILYALTISPTKAILVAAIYIGAHQVEGNIIGPLIMARAVKLHPALVAIGVVAVEQLFGFLGLVVAVPIIATFKVLVEEFWVLPMEGERPPSLIRPEPAAAGERPAGPG